MVSLRLETDTPAFFSDICDVVRVFWPDAHISMEEGERVMRHAHAASGGEWVERWSMEGCDVEHRAPAVIGGLAEKRFLKRAVKTGCFLLMLGVTGGECPPWGSLTGIRPTRLLYETLEAGMSEGEAQKWLADTFFVSEDRIRLLCDIVDMQRDLIDCPDDSYDVYLGIPFCVTRCAYCSFSSGEIGDGRLVEPYIAALIREMELCIRLTRRMGMRPRAFYMGGGTPTALSAGQLERVLVRARALYPEAVEWTVEAGRPDTIDREKLSVMRDQGIGRISVNPQTFSDDTLRIIGRAHTSLQTLEAYHLARSMGFEDINMDLIAALPGEGPDEFQNSLDACVALSPDSVTVHTLAIKRSSRLHEAGYRQADANLAQRMVDMARARLYNAGYRPYYLYRQKYMAGNLENVGYARPGKTCLYNIDNMEETGRVLALGAGAITKWLFPRERRIERAPNVKNIEEYIRRVDEMYERKRRLIMGGEESL